MDQILPNIFLGGIEAALDGELLQEKEIRAVVCCCPYTEFTEAEEHTDLGIRYHRVDVEDVSREPIGLYFPEAIEFLDGFLAKENPDNVLIHCRSGVSRSSTIALAYIMTAMGTSLHDAFFMIRARRPVITPNLGFIEQLVEYEDEQTGSVTLDLDKYTEWYTASDRSGVPDLAPDY